MIAKPVIECGYDFKVVCFQRGGGGQCSCCLSPVVIALCTVRSLIMGGPRVCLMYFLCITGRLVHVHL